MDHIETDERDHKHDPAGELMKEAECLVGVPILNAEAGADDAGDVGGDGDGDRGQCEDDAAAGAALQEVAVEDGQGKEAHERTDAAAGFGHLKLHDGQLNDVALLECGDAEHGENVAGDARGQELKREGDLVEDDLGERDREKKDQQREAHLAQHGGAREGPDQTGHQDDEGDAGGKEIDSIDAEDENDDGEDDEREASPGLANGSGTEDFTLVPEEKEGEERDEESVGVIGKGVPVVDELGSDAVVDGNKEKSKDGVRQP